MDDKVTKIALLAGLAVAVWVLVIVSSNSTNPSPKSDLPPYENPDLPIEPRIEDLLSRMTFEEKLSQLVSNAPAIERLGVPKYNWWNECLHGVKGPLAGGPTTVFPQAIGMAAAWNTGLLRRVADAIAEEARATHHHYARQGRRSKYTGLTMWAPNINIFRDPRWGRGQETYGEDPYLTSRLGVAFVRGLQGDDPRYFKVIATPKHFVAHSGPEKGRHSFDALVNERDLRDTYLPAFRACVMEGRAYSVMCAYNRLNGQPCCASAPLLIKMLREEWGFQGYVVADCAAVDDLYKHHKIVATEEEAAAAATQAGCDLACYWAERPEWKIAAERDLLSEAEVDQALRRLLRARFRLGLFDPPARVPYSRISNDALNSPAHQELALQAARESMVLLKNDRGFLPLSKTIKSIAVIGPNADDPKNALLGSYHGQPPHRITPLQGIRNAVGPATEVHFVKGCPRVENFQNDPAAPTLEFGIEEAVGLANRSDVVILCLGLSTSDEGFDRTPGLEGEETGVLAPGFVGGDRLDLQLPRPQQALLHALRATGKPIVLVLINGGALAVNRASEHCDAIIEAWYPGQEGGTAVAEVIFGEYNPAGRLPITFYKSVDDLPPFTDYAMADRTYRYFTGEVLYPFGHGLSYTRFAYSDLVIEPLTVQAGASVTVSVKVRNVGQRAGDEVVQLYLKDMETEAPVPTRSLQGFSRIHLQPGEQRAVTFSLTPRQMSIINLEMKRVTEAGMFTVWVGGKQPNFSGSADAATTEVVTGGYEVEGQTTELD